VAAPNHVLLKPLFVVVDRQRNCFAFGWYVSDRAYLIVVKDLTVRVPVLESFVRFPVPFSYPTVYPYLPALVCPGPLP
jgi:hypothetical protein